MPSVKDTRATRMDKKELHDLVLRFQEQRVERDGATVMQQIDPLILSRVRRVLRPAVEFDDLYQVARMAAFRALERWRPDGGAAFTTYATRSMDGALKRYFRDRMWDVHVTRSAKNLSLRVTRFMRYFESDHGREASVYELADFSGMTVDDVTTGMQATKAYTSDSLNVRAHEDGAELGSLIPDESLANGDREDLLDIFAEVRTLPERQQRILYLSYFGDLTQREIAEQIGCSQMHVSRLLRRSINQMKDHLVDA